MLRYLLAGLLVLIMSACTTDPALNLDQLEANARGGDQQAMAQLAGLLADRKPGVSDRVYAIMIEIGDRAVPVLLQHVHAEDKQMREYVVAALGTLKVAEAIPAISDVLAKPVLARRYVAAWALGEIGDAAAIPALIDALDDDNSEVRRYATRALIKLNKAAVLPLTDYLAGARGEGAAAAIRAVGDIADQRALEVLLLQAQGEQRAEAFLALGKLRDTRAEAALLAGLQDPDPLVRMNAAMALGPLGGPPAAEALTKTLEDDVHVVREWSARSLEKITGKPVLYRNSHDEYVRPYLVYH
ncbi:MAG: HEAT repeat domain-containing protein [Desulfuromonadales bacterium]|nr:HEAT repeat domain-containing protein [Desulfuromonadales bacterium]